MPRGIRCSSSSIWRPPRFSQTKVKNTDTTISTHVSNASGEIMSKISTTLSKQVGDVLKSMDWKKYIWPSGAFGSQTLKGWWNSSPGDNKTSIQNESSNQDLLDLESP